jgi:hypothetical protein
MLAFCTDHRDRYISTIETDIDRVDEPVNCRIYEIGRLRELDELDEEESENSPDEDDEFGFGHYESSSSQSNSSDSDSDTSVSN